MAEVYGIHYIVSRNSVLTDWRDQWDRVPNCGDNCRVPLDDRLSLVTLRFKWAFLNPESKVFDFSSIEGLLEQVAQAGKKATIVVMAGKYTPPWVFLKGAQHHDKPIPECQIARLNTYAQAHIPVPWDATYIKAYGSLMKRLSERLRSNSKLYDSVALVKFGGINVASPEFRLIDQ